MEVIVISGVEYVKASIVAKRFRYTADYVGQLCRSGKVQAKLVGRTWYVAPESLTGHRSARYAKDKSVEKTILKAPVSSPVTLSRSDVSMLGSQPSSRLKQTATPAPHPNFLGRINWQPAKYEPDQTELLPPLQPAGPAPVKLKVDPAEATRVSISSQSSAQHILEPEPLPSVALGGTLRVASLNETFVNPEEDESELQNNDISAEPEIRSGPSSPRSLVSAAPDSVSAPDEPLRQSLGTAGRTKAPFTYDVPLTISAAPASKQPSFTPALVRDRHRPSRSLETTGLSSPATRHRVFSYLLWGLVALLTVIFCLIWSLASITSLEGGVLQTTYRLQIF